MKRRFLLGGSGAALVCPALAKAAPAAPPLNLLVAGPRGGQTDRWGNACALAFSPALPGTPSVNIQNIGGLDGVSGANQFDALVPPDGKTAAILPGAALIAYLTGDPRVHFDPTRWVPVMAGVNSGVLMLRRPLLAAGIEALRAAPPLRLAADKPQSSDLAGMLGLARLGIATIPVFGMRDTDTKIRAFTASEVDAVFLCGEGLPEDAASLTAAGAAPLFDIGELQPNGSVGPASLLPGLQTASSLGPAVSPAINTAYLAAATAAQLDFLVVLPRLTAPAAAKGWVQAATSATASPALSAAASASAITLQPAPALGGALKTLALQQAAQTTMLAYLAKTCGWQPG